LSSPSFPPSFPLFYFSLLPLSLSLPLLRFPPPISSPANSLRPSISDRFRDRVGISSVGFCLAGLDRAGEAMSEVGGSNLARPPPLGPIRHTLKRHRPFPCSDPTFAPPPELRHLLDPERKIAAEAAAGPGEPKEESIFAKLHMLEAESCRTKTAEWAIGQGHSKPAASHAQASVSKAIGKRNNKQKVLKNGKSVQQIPGSNADSPPDNSLTPSNSCRYDSSLGLLTKKFVNLIKYAEDGSIDLNQAAETLEVQKRRIYDITNVLEGIGLIEKQLKNRIRWKGSDASRPGDMDSEAARLKAEVANLYFEDLALDEEIREMQDALRMLSDDPKNQRFLYVTQDDIKSLPCFQNETLISIKAPHGTTLEVPDPDDNDGYPQRRYQMLLRSMLGPIEVFLVRHQSGQAARFSSGYFCSTGALYAGGS
ncbi:Transcription factor, partial [Nymphaea thermarum]